MSTTGLRSEHDDGEELGDNDTPACMQCNVMKPKQRVTILK